jgi:hypothetical protein
LEWSFWWFELSYVFLQFEFRCLDLHLDEMLESYIGRKSFKNPVVYKCFCWFESVFWIPGETTFDEINKVFVRAVEVVVEFFRFGNANFASGVGGQKRSVRRLRGEEDLATL